MNIIDFKKEFDAIFLNELDKLIEEAVSRIHNHHISYYIKYIRILAAKGKRIRPYNTALFYTLYSDKHWLDIKNILFGLELIHLMALMHDDVMDQSEKRHGVSSMHSYIETDLTKTRTVDKKQTSNSTAILMGDLLFGWAYKEFNSKNLSKESWDIIHILVEEVILGQTLDIYNQTEISTATEDVIQKMTLKTARYTFTRPLQLGVISAGFNIGNESWISDFGDAIGLIFQTQDDIFDIIENFDTIQKEPLGDIKIGIHTIISTYIDEHGTEGAKKIWSQWFRNKELPDQKEIIEFLTDRGALTYAKNFIDNEKSRAEKAIATSSLNMDKKNHVMNLLSMILIRNH